MKNFIQANVFNDSLKMTMNYREEILEFGSESASEQIVRANDNYFSQLQTAKNQLINQRLTEEDMHSLAEKFKNYFENQ